jgi:hypothetical protein
MPTFGRLIPLLVYEDIAAAHDFLVTAFGFDAGGVHRNAEGHAVHGDTRNRHGRPEGLHYDTRNQRLTLGSRSQRTVSKPQDFPHVLPAASKVRKELSHK